MKKLISLSILALSVVSAHAADFSVTAQSLSTNCQEARVAVKAGSDKYNKKDPKAIYAAGQCEGYLQGWLMGIDNTYVEGKQNVYHVTVQWDSLANIWAIADALNNDLRQVPLDGGKPATDILVKVLLNADVLKADVVKGETATPAAGQKTL